MNNKRYHKELSIYLDNNLVSESNLLFIKNKNAILINHMDNIAKFLLQIDNRRKIIITFEIEPSYPFIKPKVTINGNNYFYYLQVDGLQLKEINHKHNCLCCNSILCNWSPSLGLNHIISEILDVLILKRRIIDRLFCKQITNQIFGTYLPIIEYL